METNQGKGQAKLGMWMIVASNLITLAVLIFQIKLEKGMFIMLGGAGTVGLVMIFVALTKHKFRAKWVFWFLFAYAFLLLLNPPMGTIVGISIS